MRACAFAQSHTEPSLLSAYDKPKTGHLVTLAFTARLGWGGGGGGATSTIISGQCSNLFNQYL